MSLPLIILRPEPGNSASLAAARAFGLDAYGFPLFAMRQLTWLAPEPETFDALLIGSANAIRHGGEGLARYAGKPAYAVGEASAAAAKAAGLAIAAVGAGDMQGLLTALQPGHCRLLRIAARDRVALASPAGVTIREVIAYAAEPLPLAGPLALLLSARALPGAVVALHSAAAARQFGAECTRLSLPRWRLRLAAISPRALAAAGTGWGTTAVASRPDEAALLELAARMCDGEGNG